MLVFQYVGIEYGKIIAYIEYYDLTIVGEIRLLRLFSASDFEVVTGIITIIKRSNNFDSIIITFITMYHYLLLLYI